LSTTHHLEGLCLALTEGRPIVLLLGQDAWRSGTRPDPVLEIALRRAGRHPSQPVSVDFSWLLQAEPLPEHFYDWLAEKYTHQPEPTWLEPISRLPLNAVFTSSIDPAITRALRINGRDVEPVLSKDDDPAAPRNRRNLHLTYLFGRAGERNSHEGPPRSTLELKRRTALHATSLLSRIVETTTPLGVLLVDGLSVGRDWLGTDALSGILSAFSPGQVYWFGWVLNESHADLENLRDLAAPRGPIVFVQERLSAALGLLELAHKIDISSPKQFASEGSVSIRDRVLVIEPATRLKVSTAASIVEDTWVAPLPPLGSDAEYAEFRRFHGHVEDARRLVEGLRRGFAIERTFESELRERVRRALLNAGRKQEPVLIHGQSGSGKSLALARLAYRIRQEAIYPVLLASRATRMPAVEELDDFCLQAEEAGAEATLVICDANAPASRYGDLIRGFISRGRRVVVVGSAYRIVDERDGDEATRADHLLEVPAELDGAESSALAKLVNAWTGVTFQALGSKYLLPAIYRILPDVRPRLAAGLAQEARVAEDDLRARGAANSAAPPEPAGALGQALVDAGLVDPKALLDQKLDDFLGTMSDAATKAIDLVMVPGKLDCPVPVNLLMRAVGGSESLVDVAALFSGIDLFRWSSNDEDDVFVHPRLRVEAELISARRLGTATAEAEVALRLLASANPSSYGSCERRFVLDLVQEIGPDGSFGRRYASHYLDIARALTDMRNKRGVKDPSLMLQEATLRRRVFRDAPDIPGLDPAAILEEARQVVDLALNEFSANTSPGLRRACANLKVERAAIYGFRAVQRLTSGAGLDEVWQFYKAARDSARSAVFAADSYYAIDVSVWVPSDLLRYGNWEPERRAELVADIWDGLERVDPTQLDPEQQERFEERRIKVAQTLRDNRLEQDALAALDRLGSRAGVFLQAREIGGALWGLGKVTKEDASKADHVISFMRDHHDKIRDDARCLRYFLRGLWIIATGNYLFGGERSPLPEQEEELRDILSILDTLGHLEGALGDPRTQYLRAVLMWRLRREHGAREVWNSLSRETAFSDPRRVVRHHVWTEAGGQARLFYGRITSDDLGRGRARVQVDELRQEVELLQRDFPSLDLRRGAGVSGGFHIAFNFIGPVADSPRRLGGSR
jgi:hypothetical protein